MANYQNGQPVYAPHNHPAQSHDGSNNAYSSQPSHNDPSLRRPSSFDAGDDSRAFPQGEDSSRWGSSYAPGIGNSPGYQANRTQPMSVQTSIPYRSNTQTVALSGYQHQYVPQTSPHAVYNPAQYQYQQHQTQAQYNPNSYQTPQTAFPTNSSYQPYVPAAYQPSNVTRQASIYNTNNYYNQAPQTTFPSAQPPPPPPRPTEYTSQHSSSYGGYQHEPQYPYASQYPSANSAPNRQSTYSTAAPAPPPHNTSILARPYSHSTSASHDRSSLSSLGAQPWSDIHRNSSIASHVSNQSSSFSPSPQPSLPTPPSRQPSNRSPQRSNTLDRHPQGRSLPGVPSESESENDYFGPSEVHHQSGESSRTSGFDDIMHDLDSAIGRRASQGGVRDYAGRTSGDGSPQPLLSPDEAPTHLNGNIASTGDAYINYGAFSDDSDAEAAAGLAAMQALDEQEKAEDARRRSGSATLFPTQNRQSDADLRPPSAQDLSSDSDYTGYDLGAAGGGYAPNLSYGDDMPVSNYAAAAAIMPHSELYERLNPRMSSVRSSGMSSEGRDSQASGFDSIPPNDSHHPFTAIRDVARVDTGGTGGLTEPSPHPRRLSYEDGDEGHFEWDEGPTPESGSPSKESIPELFFHPGLSQQRPLPPTPSNSDPGGRVPLLMPAGTYTQQSRFSQYTDNRSSYYPTAPENYASNTLLSPSAVPRSTSLTSQRSQPRADQPMRSKTDADRAKILRQQQLGRPLSDVYDPSEPSSAIAIDLPTIPRKKFNPAKLSNDQFKKCSEPWALSSVLAWIKDLADEETDLRESAVIEGIVALFSAKVPTMNTTDAEVLGDRVVKDMFSANALVKDEEWVKFGPGTMSGVLFQLTGSGCYSSKLHVYESRGRCYAHHCMRTLKVVDMSSLSDKKSEDWATYYKMKKEDIEGHDKKEIERQYNMHEIVTGEADYLGALDILRTLYRDRLQNAQPSVIPSKKLPGFLKDVFGQIDKVKKVNQDYLLGRLRYRQNEQGPWIVGFSDIFREWIRRARAIYVDYATNYPKADFLMRREAERNLQFRAFLDSAREDRRSNRLGWDNYLKSPITRLQRYSLLLQVVLKNTLKDSEEKTNLEYALDEVKAATHECDLKLAEQEKKMQLHEYAAKLKLRPPMEKDVELNLDHLGREVILAGNILRAGGKGFNWVETHAILFDHYMVLSKREKDHYDVSKVPIPMDLLVLESDKDGPVVKSGVKGIGAVTSTVVVPRGQTPSDPRLNRTTSTASGGSGGLQHTNTSNSLGSSGTNPSIVPITTIETNSKDEKIMYPFRIKHLGRSEVYTLFAPSAQNRLDWCEAIITAKTKHAEQLYSQNSEPFRLRVLADTAFGYDGLTYASKRIAIRGTPLDRAIQESEKKFAGQGRPAPVCRAPVNCATVFNQPYGRLMCAVGTDYGVYISEYQNSRGWMKSIQLAKVTQISVLEEFNLFLLIADKVLIAYHLDVVCPPSGNPLPQNDSSSRRAPQRLSGSKDVGFFVTGRMKDRTLVFYKKRDGINSTFKVLEPVLQKNATSRSRFLPSSSRRGQTEFFREYDEFYIPTECYSLNLFQTSMAVSTVRGVEVLNLEKKMPWTVPNLRSENSETQAHLASIANRIKDLRPLGMYRLGESEFLVVFDECAVYVNKHGDVSRGVVMEFVGRAKSACLYGQFIILFDDDFVEIRDAQNGRLKQVIAGKDIRLLDDGGAGTGAAQSTSGGQAALGGGMNGLGLQGFGAAPRTVKLCMQHPEYEKSHVIVELLLNSDKEE